LAADTEKRVESFGELVDDRARQTPTAARARSVRGKEERRPGVGPPSKCIITIDHEGKILEFNPAAEATFGYRARRCSQEMAELISRRPAGQHHRGLDRYLETRRGRVCESGSSLRGYVRTVYEFPVELTVTPITVAGLPMFTLRARHHHRKRGEQERARLLTGERAARARRRGQASGLKTSRGNRPPTPVATLVAQGARARTVCSTPSETRSRRCSPSR